MNKNQVQLSPQFKARTRKAIVAILFFALTYFLLLALAVGLTIVCVYSGVLIFTTFPQLFTILLGLGIASLGVLVLIFLVKFIFKSHQVDRSHLYEMKRGEEPTLFALIDEIVGEVGTDFPKKVYLSTDVNAAVFYDSSFWSMVFPIRKNLQIGLGLVNAVTKTELKAILSHEFGHFSQKTMKLGSYVYNVNQVIFNMLHDNESYDKIIQSWASISSFFVFFIAIAVRIIQGIQWLLTKLYAVVNKSYMGLSREMEFHADEIAAHVTGYEPLKSSLLRMDLVSFSFQTVLSFYENKIADNVSSKNIYQDQLFVLNFLAKNNKIPVVNNLPKVAEEELNKFNKSKLVIENQWASHPSTEDRIERLEQTNLTAKQAAIEPATVLFENIKATQEKLTKKLFQEIPYEGEVARLGKKAFRDAFRKEFLENTFSKIYNGYYDDKNPMPFDFEVALSSKEEFTLDELFSDQKVELVYTAVHLEQDIETLQQIANKEIPIKTFDYAGQKYKRKRSTKLLKQLRTELETLHQAIKQNDQAIFAFFYELEAAKSPSELEERYRTFFDYEEAFKDRYRIYEQLQHDMQFISYTTTFEQIKLNFKKIAQIEKKLKTNIQVLLAHPDLQRVITREIQATFDKYLSQDWAYFDTDNYLEDNLQLLYTVLNYYVFLLSKGYFQVKKNVLKYQEKLWVRKKEG